VGSKSGFPWSSGGESNAYGHAPLIDGRLDRPADDYFAHLDYVIARAAAQAKNAGLEVHAGHGLDFITAEKIAGLAEIVELNIGHFLIGEAIFDGLEAAVRAMRAAMDRGRARGAA